MATRKNRRGGGSGGQPLSWVDPKAYEPSAPAGADLLGVHGNIVRPKIGGFFPSVMGGVIQNGNLLLLPSVASAKKLLNSRKTRKAKRGGGKMNDYRIDFEKAKRNLKQYIPEGQKGAPAKNIQALVAVRRGTSKKFKSEEEMIADFKARMGERGKPKPKAAVAAAAVGEAAGEGRMTREEEWAAYKALATAQLKNVTEKPRQANILKLAGILRADQEPNALLANVQSRVAKAVKVAKTPRTPGKKKQWEAQKAEARRQLELVLSSPQRKEILALAKILKAGEDPADYLATVRIPKQTTRKIKQKKPNASAAAAAEPASAKKSNGRKIWGQTLKTARQRLTERVNHPSRKNVLRVAKTLAANGNLTPVLDEIAANYTPVNKPLNKPLKSRSKMIPYEEGAPLPNIFLNKPPKSASRAKKPAKTVRIKNTPNVRVMSPPANTPARTASAAAVNLAGLKQRIAAQREQKVMEKMAEYSDEE